MRKQNENNNIVTKQETEPVGAISIARRAQRKCLKHTQNGITLVALVITIIVLLILAGVTINLTLGERGIFRVAEKAAKNYQDSQQEEMYGLNSLQNEINDTISEIGQGTTNTETSTVPIPDGGTAEVNSIITWLKCAELEDEYSYTTIEEVVADSNCIEKLMNNENAMKYLARSTGFAEGICVNETAMTYLGQSTYVDDTAFKSESWSDAINNSAYFEKVFFDKVPTMTSSVTPYGEVITGYINSQAIFAPYYVFDKNNGTEGQTSLGGYIGYKFTKPICVKRVYVRKACLNNQNYTIQASNNGSDWVSFKNVSLPGTVILELTTDIKNNNYYLYWRMLQNASDPQAFDMCELQFYGRYQK